MSHPIAETLRAIHRDLSDTTFIRGTSQVYLSEAEAADFNAGLRNVAAAAQYAADDQPEAAHLAVDEAIRLLSPFVAMYDLAAVRDRLEDRP